MALLVDIAVLKDSQVNFVHKPFDVDKYLDIEEGFSDHFAIFDLCDFEILFWLFSSLENFNESVGEFVE